MLLQQVQCAPLLMQRSPLLSWLPTESILVRLLSEAHALSAGAYTEKVAEAAAANQDFVMGFICQTPAKWSTQSPPGNAAELAEWHLAVKAA